MVRSALSALFALATAAWAADPPPPPPPGTTDAKVWSDYLAKPPVWRDEVDLRPEFNRLGLHTETQGARPSCAVFAVTGALEFQIARLPGGNFQSGGRARRLSEDYLLWGTLRESRSFRAENSLEGEIAGFSYQEVCLAATRHGLAWQDEVPNTFEPGLGKLPEPSGDVSQAARNRWRIRAQFLEAKPGASLLDQTVALLNAGVPVAIGLDWPSEASLRHAPVLHAQPPSGTRHGVLIVGYWEKNSERERRLIFRNSYGPRWGRAGHGFISPEYFAKHVSTALFLTVEPRP